MASYADLMGQWNTALNTQINTPPNAEHFAAMSTIQNLNDQMYGLGQYAGQGPVPGAAEYWAQPQNRPEAMMGAQDQQNWVNSNHQMGPQGSVIQNNMAGAAAYPETGLPPGQAAPWMQPGWLNTPQSIQSLSHLGVQMPQQPGPSVAPAFSGQPPGVPGPRAPSNWGMAAGQALAGGNQGRANYMVPAWLRPLWGGQQ
jgi:hypothetical protein